MAWPRTGEDDLGLILGDVESMRPWGAEDGDGKLKRPEDFTDFRHRQLAEQVWREGEQPKGQIEHLLWTEDRAREAHGPILMSSEGEKAEATQGDWQAQHGAIAALADAHIGPPQETLSSGGASFAQVPGATGQTGMRAAPRGYPGMEMRARPGSESEARELTRRERTLHAQEQESQSTWEKTKRIAEAPLLGAGAFLSKLAGIVGYAAAQAPPVGYMGQPSPSMGHWAVNYPEVEQNAQAVRDLGEEAAQAISDYAISRAPDSAFAAALAGGAYALGEEGAEYATTKGVGKVKGAFAPSRAALAAAAQRQARMTLGQRVGEAARRTVREVPLTVGEAVIVKGETEPREIAKEIVGDFAQEMVGVLPDVPAKGTRSRKWPLVQGQTTMWD
jgi:hypothetical protein